jgi:hypothetical protein
LLITGRVAAATSLAFAICCAAGPVGAQAPAPGETVGQNATREFSPAIEITNVGWDDNVFRVSKGNGPEGDYTATFSPLLRASIPVSRVQFSGSTRVDFNYFHRLEAIRSVDTDNRADVSVVLGRLRPHVGGSWLNARHRRNFEIDLPVRHQDRSWDAGVDIGVSSKTAVGVTTRHGREEYTGETVYLDSDLAILLGATSTAHGVGVRYALTPLTTVGAEFERDHERFPHLPARDADGVRIMSVVEFRPLALVSGEARIGVRSRTFSDRNAPPFRGTVARVDLSYTLLGRTRFTVKAQRDLSYSYRPGERDYLQTGTEVWVTQRMGTAWDVLGSVGRFNLLYGLSDRSARTEKVFSYGVDVGRNMVRSRVGFQVGRQTRSSDFSAFREYEETRVSSSLTFRF